MSPDAFDYALPPERIAQHPTTRRGDARMLRVGPPPIVAHARDLVAHVPAGALVVTNRSRVVPARLMFTRDDGRSFELLVCDPSAAQGPGTTVRAWVRGAKRLKAGELLSAGALTLRLRGADPVDPRARIWDVVAGEVLPTLRAHGSVPLPPYIVRPEGPHPHDAARYQTVYAGPDGSVAAPTAGLHLETEILAALDVVSIVLHVGPGTFLPMEVDDVADHRVGAERISIDEHAAAAIEAARRDGRPILAVGTTVVRALEGVAARGGEVSAGDTTTDLVITPGFPFRVVTHLLTNFHLPRSSLLMLTCALGGHARVMDAYRHAVAEQFRFYSYGDCMLLSRQESRS